MRRFHRLLNMVLPILLMALSACNLSLGQPLPTATVPILATSTFQIPTQTRQPTSTISIPTVTSRPPATNAPAAYNVRQPIPGPVCSVFPNVAAANIRSGPGTTFAVLGVLPANNWVLATRLDQGGWYQVSYAGTVVHNGWISSSVVDLQQPCSCGPNNCTVVNPPTIAPPPTNIPPTSPPPNQCTVTVLSPGDVVNIYYQPSTEAGVWDTLRSGMVVTGRTNDGWYAVGPLNLQGGNVGIYTLRWIRSDARINLTGAPCGSLKTIDLSYPPPAACTVSPVNISSVPIYLQHSFQAGVAGTLTAGSSLPVVGQTPANTGGAPNGWYAVDTGAAQAGTVGRYRLRWIPIDGNVAVNGDCGIAGPPTVTLDP